MPYTTPEDLELSRSLGEVLFYMLICSDINIYLYMVRCCDTEDIWQEDIS